MRGDLRRMGVTNWRICAHRRDDWKMVMKEAKVLQGLYSHGFSSSRKILTASAGFQPVNLGT